MIAEKFWKVTVCAHIGKASNKKWKLWFNFDVAKTMVSTECFLQKKGLRFTFFGCSNDGISVLGPQMTTKKEINLMKVIRVIKGLATIPETYHAHI